MKLCQYTLSVVIGLFVSNYGFAQSFNWVKSAGGFGHDIGTKICVDGSNNIYVTMNAGGGGNAVYFSSDTLIVNGLSDIFLAKYDVSGTEVWVKQYGGNNSNTNPYFGEGFSTLLYDSINSSLYLAGQFYETITFDTISLVGNVGSTDDFIAKFDLNGNCQWAKLISSTGSHRAPAMALDNLGSLYAVGALSNTGVFDTTSIQSGVYFAKLDANGNMKFVNRVCDWNWQFSSPSFVYGEVKYARDKVFILGACYDTLTIDTRHLPSINSQYSQLMTVWDTTGHIIWARNSNDADTFDGTFTLDADGNSYILNSFQSSWIRFDADTIFSEANTGGYILKYDIDGSLIWINSIGVGKPFSPKCSSMDYDNNLYFAGRFRDSLTFGNFNMVSNFNYNLFVVRFDTSGLCIGVRQADWAEGIDLVNSNSNGLYITGGFSNTGGFGSISISSQGSSDIFLANLSAITGSGGGERLFNNQLIIYANPNKGSFRVQLPDVISDLRGALLTVYDVQGKEVARFDLTNKEENPQLEINNATSGFYTVRLVKENSIFTGKLVVE